MADDPEHLATEAERLLGAGDLAGAAALLGRASRALQRAGKLVDATAAALAAARMLATVGDHGGAGRHLDDADKVAARAGMRNDALRARAELADLAGDPHAIGAAWQRCLAEGDAQLGIAAVVKLATLARNQARNDDAAALFADGIVRARALGLATAEAQLRIERAVALTEAGNLDEAAAELDRAERSTPPQDVAQLASPIAGQRGMVALHRGFHATALRHGEAARTAAVEVADGMAYLAASTLLLLVHQAAGRLVEAYDTLLRARESLRDLHGDAGAALVAPALEQFKAALGERFAAVHDEWVAMRQSLRSAT